MTNLKQGDIVELEYRRKTIGYFYKDLDDRVILSSSSDVDDGAKLKVVMKEDLINLATFSVHAPKEKKKEESKEEMGKILEFKPRDSDGEGA